MWHDAPRREAFEEKTTEPLNVADLHDAESLPLNREIVAFRSAKVP